MTRIASVALRRVLDSHGSPAVEADILTESGGSNRTVAPNGVSAGEYEAVELPPTKAITTARRYVVPRLVDEVHAGSQREVDATPHAADGSENFSEIDANSAVTISTAAARAGADVLGMPLYQHLGGAFRGDNFPTPLGNVIGGGKHAKEATNIREFLTAPIGAPSVSETVLANAKVHARASEILGERGAPVAKGDEGAWAPPVSGAEVFGIMGETVSGIEGELGFEIGFGLDIAASGVFEDDIYHYGNETKTTNEQIDYIAEMVDEYDLVHIENPLGESDREGFTKFTERAGDHALICSDDLFVTSVDRLQGGIDVGVVNSIFIEPNQIGTLTDAFDAVELTSRNGADAVISHRSGETEDATIAHLAVATDAPFTKTGTVQGKRTAKLNELIHIVDGAV